jgi:uncharacterized SAM-binding protein YcdF (DUF218 family)
VRHIPQAAKIPLFLCHALQIVLPEADRNLLKAERLFRSGSAARNGPRIAVMYVIDYVGIEINRSRTYD